MMETSIPEMHIFLQDDIWNKMIKTAQIVKQSRKKKFSTDANMKFIYKKYIMK